MHRPADSLTRLERGANAETLAARYLEARGLTLIERNYRCRLGELDLICLDGDTLVIVEVRQRTGADFGGALASITWRKQRKIVRATQSLLQRRQQWRTHRIRFDVIGVHGAPDAIPNVLWIQDAFRVG